MSEENEEAPEPLLDLPFPLQVNPHVEAVRRASLEWCQGRGLLRSEAAADAYLSWDLAFLAATGFPGAREEPLAEVTTLLSFGFLLDDQIDHADPERGVLFAGVAQELVAIMFRPRDAPLGLSTPATRAFGELWRFTNVMSASWRERFAINYAQWLMAFVQENAVAHRWLSVDEYIALRRLSVGLLPTLDQCELAGRFEIPVQVAAHPAFRAMRQDVADAIAFTNDVQSARREAARADRHNLVLILQQEHACTPGQARRRVAAMAQEAVTRFVHRAEELREVCQTMRLSDDEQRAVEAAVAGCRSWLVGNYHWGQQTGRYRNIAGLAHYDDVLT